MKGKDELMLQALGLAFGRMGSTSPNPAVGAVIARGDKVISTGGTCPCGSDHAEVTAISSAAGDTGGADMYVTLEPCNHYGKTPPCTEAIIACGIKNVYIPILDPNPIVSGRGVQRLREAGVNVEIMHRFAPAAADLIRPFRKNIITKTPFIVHKCAMTLDGRTATVGGDSRWITSEASRYVVHKLRARVDAVIIGKSTLSADDPSLNPRPGEFSCAGQEGAVGQGPVMAGRDNFFLRSLICRVAGECSNPLRVVAGVPENIDPSAKIFADDRYVIFENAASLDRLRRDAGFRQRTSGLNIVGTYAQTPAESAAEILDHLHKRGVMFAMLEGGSRLAGSFLEAGLIDQFMYFIAPRIAGAGIPAIDGGGSERMADSLSLKDVTTVMIGEDMLFNGYREECNVEIM